MYGLARATTENLKLNLSDHRMDMVASEEQIRAKAHGFEMHHCRIAWDRLPVAGKF